MTYTLNNQKNMGLQKLFRTRRRNADILSIRQVFSTRLSAIYAADFPGYLACKTLVLNWLNKWLRFLLVCIFMLLTQQAMADDQIRTLLHQASQGGKYVPADVTELEKAELLFFRMLEKKHDQQLLDDWSVLGFDLITLREQNEEYVVLREKINRKEGRGFYLFRLDSNNTSILQAPHSFKDLRTREITLAMMLQSDFSAAAWNTVPRNYSEGVVVVNADMAHLSQTFFIAFSRAAVRKYAQGNLLQLHGYSRNKRRTSAGKKSALILSSGTSIASNNLLRINTCLQQNVADESYIYPSDVRELGGTTNTIGKALRQMKHDNFMHIEISREIRERLLIESKLQRDFIHCLSI